ncbi:DDB1- and CUL4-associated factor 12-like [Dendronephthya gigantea]|uniref:DDB1- and CUL4-associated factor 12-like n=1 Tax=Dendronephthya gigantea TaxID=151771 RepID=UPI00106C0264|nr:DDB1- and CUL4-associated factor 12-like [Dendronephthya gigantea]
MNCTCGDDCTCMLWMSEKDRNKAYKNSVFRLIQERKRSGGVYPNKVLKSYVTRRLPHVFRAKDFTMGTIDKIFASHWLDDRNVVYGTKCNKLCILDTCSGKSSTIPMIKGETAMELENNCGIHSLEINPSRTLLATGGDSPNDLAIYKLPEFHPLCLGVEHKDWIFSIVWLNDYLVATGSRDGCLAVWDIRSESNTEDFSDSLLIKSPVRSLTSIHSDERFRAIQYNPVSNELASLSTKAILHIWDANRLTTISSVDLPYQQENVCLSLEPGNSLYAVGSQSHVTMLDGRCPSSFLYSVESIEKDAGIRSLSFHHEVVTIGSGFGTCSFLDLRTCRYILKPDGKICQLKAGEGWLRRDEFFYTLFGEMYFPTAIYTHCYDPSGSKLFTGGGPLAVGLYGNYAALWQ